jgi:hypothetical protein
MHGPRLVVGPNNQGRYEWDQAGMHTYHAWPRTPPSPLLLFMQQGRGAIDAANSIFTRGRGVSMRRTL